MENTNPSPKTRAAYLRKVRESKNLTRETVSTDLGYSASAIQTLEKTGNTKLTTFCEVCDYYKLSSEVVLSLIGMQD